MTSVRIASASHAFAASAIVTEPPVREDLYLSYRKVAPIERVDILQDCGLVLFEACHEAITICLSKVAICPPLFF